jgi:hypothetical protein
MSYTLIAMGWYVDMAVEYLVYQLFGPKVIRGVMNGQLQMEGSLIVPTTINAIVN